MAAELLFLTVRCLWCWNSQTQESVSRSHPMVLIKSSPPTSRVSYVLCPWVIWKVHHSHHSICSTEFNYESNTKCHSCLVMCAHKRPSLLLVVLVSQVTEIRVEMRDNEEKKARFSRGKWIYARPGGQNPKSCLRLKQPVTALLRKLLVSLTHQTHTCWWQQ